MLIAISAWGEPPPSQVPLPQEPNVSDDLYLSAVLRNFYDGKLFGRRTELVFLKKVESFLKDSIKLARPSDRTFFLTIALGISAPISGGVVAYDFHFNRDDTCEALWTLGYSMPLGAIGWYLAHQRYNSNREFNQMRRDLKWIKARIRELEASP